ncbi:DUF6445 family protein [Hyphococcus luteus]|uniref:Uncharacterized protein n=1 Tax=Hyphococcus luteus TaxID=2058213 RepID=A0A2S7KAP5_9PROT|nr:DUF6445 family protein [Marinicaulis flavus]PQA89509.1 hypothetical protein CW354_01155 [Marinicaulis flavus]
MKIEKIGREEEPVVILDNATAGADALIDTAANREFKKKAPNDPGMRAPAPVDYAQSMIAAFEQLIGDVFGLRPASLAATACDFSLVTTPPEKCGAMQRLPHYTATDPTVLTILHFLCGETYGAVGFYRHRATGFETVNDARLRRYQKVLEAEIAEHGTPETKQASGPAPLFEQIARFPAVFNRILIFRGVALRAADIPEDCALPEDPRAGRLTVNTLIKGAG